MPEILEYRHCYICGIPLNYWDFFMSAWKSGKFNKIGRDMVFEIWGNPIFILRCCNCHNLGVEII